MKHLEQEIKYGSQEEELLNVEQAAKFLNLSPKTLNRWRSEKRHLSYYLIGGAVRYKVSDLSDFAESRRVSIAL